MTHVKLFTTLAVLFSLGIGAACTKPKGPSAAELEAQRLQDEADAARRAAEEAAERDRLARQRAAEEAAERDRLARQQEEARKAAEARAAMEAAARAVLVDVNFDYNKSDILRADREKLQAIAAFMTTYPDARVTIEGHCDERGTIEYNMALGERRAYAAKNYLTGLGVAESRFRTVSYGKEKPKVHGSNERSWKVNRRCEFKLQ